MNVLIVNGPNLNLLGTREPEIYGSDTLMDLERRWRRHGARLGISVRAFQSNHEGEIIDQLHTEGKRSDGVVINAGAYSHTSYAIHDALIAIDTPSVEVHISDIRNREPWRAHSVTAPATVLTIIGRGTVGYLNALDHLWAIDTAPPTVLTYGDSPDHRIDLRTPKNPRGVVVLLHGGFWGDVWARDIMDPMAVRLYEEGWITANVEYRRGPGSFRDATNDVSHAVDRLLDHVSNDGHGELPTVLAGHSAGGYLALREAADRTGAAALGLAPVIDLASCSQSHPDDDHVTRFLGASATEDPSIWRDASIDESAPGRVAIVHGSNDESIPIDHSAGYAAGHENVDLITLDGVDHMSLIDPSLGCFRDVVAALERLTG